MRTRRGQEVPFHRPAPPPPPAPEVQGRVDAEMAAIAAKARDTYPERYAPNGEPLSGYPGSSWTERRAAWYLAHGYPEVPA